jgi:hypothetical protein
MKGKPIRNTVDIIRYQINAKPLSLEITLRIRSNYFQRRKKRVWGTILKVRLVLLRTFHANFGRVP